MQLQGDVAGTEPEQVLVLETVGSVVDFINAVRRTAGLEWLGEVEAPDLEPAEDFAQAQGQRGGTLYLVMTNSRALEEVLSLWRRYRAGERLPWGFGRWTSVFGQLNDVRPWGPQDRLALGLRSDWAGRVALGVDTLPVEVELWYRRSDERRAQAETAVQSTVRDLGGEVRQVSVLPEIAYHALLCSLPAAAVPDMARLEDVALARAQDVMFLRPTGQFAVAPGDGDAGGPRADAPAAMATSGRVRAALFDGLPLEHHVDLDGRLTVDDPDGWGEAYPAESRAHGTSMASIIIHGDLSEAEVPLPSPLYVRPVMRPDPADWFNPSPLERIPDLELPVDLIHRAIRRMLEGDGPETAAAPSVRVVNFSVCDSGVPFTLGMSPLARLLDWASYRWNVLFVVSGGNHTLSFRFEMSPAELASLPPDRLQALSIIRINEQGAERRLHSPGEALNVLTVASSHDDASTESGDGHDLIIAPELLSPLNPLGRGYRRSVKPDILLPGGRQLYQVARFTANSVELTPRRRTSVPPGVLSSAPPSSPGDLHRRWFTCGTSNSTALATRWAASLVGRMDDGTLVDTGAAVPETHQAVVAKALLVHAAGWADVETILQDALEAAGSQPDIRNAALRFLGYGAVDGARLNGCSPRRATLIGWGSLPPEAGAVYDIPLPPSLSGQPAWRRAVVTLAWMTPINPHRAGYRGAKLWYEVESELLGVMREEAQWQAVRRGTVQHEVFEGSRTTSYREDATFAVKVSCAADALNTDDPIPFALAVSVEVAADLQVSVYEEVRARLRVRVPVAPDAR